MYGFMRFSNTVIKTIALCTFSGLLLAGCGAGADADGGYTANGMAECAVEDAGISYPVYLLVKTDETGVILSVEDDGTEVPDGKDAKYVKAQALFETLVGKGMDDLSDVDAVSGATYSSAAILSAVEQALTEIEGTIQSEENAG